MITKIDEQYKKRIEWFNQYLITYRKNYLRQLGDGTYITCPNSAMSDTRGLNDKFIQEHLKHEKTFGTLYSNCSRFIMFDIDCKNLEYSKQIHAWLKDALIAVGIPPEYIHTEFSGKKGYHVYVFFERYYNMDNCLNTLQRAVINQVISAHPNEVSINNIEVRPTPTHGIKLPLGIHQETKKICWFCDENLNPIKSQDYIFGIKALSHERSKKILSKVKMQNNIDASLLRAIKQKNKSCNRVSNEFKETAENAIKNGIKVSGIRHNTLVLLACYFKKCGRSEEKCQQALSEWMSKQNPDVIKTPQEQWQADVNRVVHDIYQYRFEFTDNLHEPSKIYVSKCMLEYICENTKTKASRLVLFQMLVNQMRFQHCLEDGGFRYSNSHIEATAGVSANSAKKIPVKLHKAGLIERETNRPAGSAIVKALSFYGNEPTWYRVNDKLRKMIEDLPNISDSEKAEIDPEMPTALEFCNVVVDLMNESEINKYFSQDFINKYLNFQRDLT